MTDVKRPLGGRVWQLFSRFTWELPQTTVGWLYTLSRALVGKVDRVDTLGGITFATHLTPSSFMGVSLGTFVDLWAGDWLGGHDEGFVTGHQICMHEFGHTFDSQRFGWMYLPVVGLSSLISALGKGDHDSFWTEIRANRHAKRYFSRHYGLAWSEGGYPTERQA